MDQKHLPKKELDLTATLDIKRACCNANFVVMVAPSNVYAEFSV